LEHRADALFALPELPASATVVGKLPAWERDLAERGVALVRDSPDLVVASPDALSEALGSRANALIVDGGRRAAPKLRDEGFAVRRLLPVPVRGAPVVYLDTESRTSTSYGLRHCVSHTQRWRALRNRAAARLAGLGVLPLPDGVVSIAVREPGPPKLLAVAAELGAPADAAWLMLVSLGSVVRRNALLLFPPGGREPDLAVKFSRLPGESGQFDREERGLALAARAGGSVAAHAPRHLGRADVRGHHLSVESAGAGTKLAELLRLPGSRRRKLAVLESIASWLVGVARQTAAPPPALQPELDRLAREVLPLWSDRGVDPALATELPPLPASLQHNDVAEENLIVSSNGFTVVDWEWVEPQGIPLGDILYFGCRVLRLLDGALDEEQRDRHFEELVTGGARSSPILFRWVRELAGALALPAEAVGPLVTLTWLDRAAESARERRRAEAASGRRLDPDYAERCADTWMRHPRLGPGWMVWQDDR
jgi:hypothetical protein